MEDKLFSDYPERDLEIVNQQIEQWENFIKGQEETLSFAMRAVEDTRSMIYELKEKKRNLKAQIDAETMGSPKDK